MVLFFLFFEWKDDDKNVLDILYCQNHTPPGNEGRCKCLFRCTISLSASSIKARPFITIQPKNMTGEIDPFSTHTGPFFMRIKNLLDFCFIAWEGERTELYFLLEKTGASAIPSEKEENCCSMTKNSEKEPSSE